MQTTLRDLVFARLSAGKSRLASTPIIAMTTINSIRVKPERQSELRLDRFSLSSSGGEGRGEEAILSGALSAFWQSSDALLFARSVFILHG